MKYLAIAALCAAVLPAFGQGRPVVLNPDAHYPEGPIWYQDKLYYIEYDRNAVMTWDGRKNEVFSSQKGCGQSAVIPSGHGDFLTTCYDNGTIGRIAADGTLLPPYTHDRDGNAFNGPNDFAPDGHGGIYFSCSGSHDGALDGRVFYIAADGTISLKADYLYNTNGLAVSKDGTTLYVVETEARRLLKFKIGADGSLSDRRVFVNLDELTKGVEQIWPDGVKIDSRGRIYIGQSARKYGAKLAGVIFVVDAAGGLIGQLHLPSLQVPNFAFSPDEKTLYVMALDQIDKPPFRGKVYALPLP